MRFRAVIWDFGGTICDTTPATTVAFAAALADFGITTPPETIAGLVQQSRERCARTLAAEHDLDSDAILAHFFNHYRRISPEDQPLFPGVARIFERIEAAGGYNLLFTHRGRDSLRRFLAAHDIECFFVASIVAEEDGFPRKPDPGALIYLIERFDLKAADVLTVGDRELDIQAGQAAGIHTCLFGEVPLSSIQPDYFITAYAQLEAILFPAD
jgi:HAD superfamily hydrolase (TIGR01549 family)